MADGKSSAGCARRWTESNEVPASVIERETSSRRASCRCGQLCATATGDPVRLSVCHCLDCKKRSGSAFAVQARWARENVRVEGASNAFVKIADSGNRASFHFCPQCGSDVFYVAETMAELVAIPLGAFDDPFFGTPDYSVFEDRKQAWVEIVGDHIERPQ